MDHRCPRGGPGITAQSTPMEEARFLHARLHPPIRRDPEARAPARASGLRSPGQAHRARRSGLDICGARQRDHQRAARARLPKQSHSDQGSQGGHEYHGGLEPGDRCEHRECVSQHRVAGDPRRTRDEGCGGGGPTPVDRRAARARSRIGAVEEETARSGGSPGRTRATSDSSPPERDGR